jgi:hypothetical protein
LHGAIAQEAMDVGIVYHTWESSFAPGIYPPKL